ncbi:class I SAM-dependent methyltransferase [Luteimonas sp. FXH3W]|uniref:Class I SAM-dependent methyltransferase n=1 Tax=Aquilutibacter rugosus TaxID=3115820 RepID=A0ABU7V0V8_9GAMM
MRLLFRRITPLYWAVGVVRYVRFRQEVRRADQKYWSSDEYLELPPPNLRFRVHKALDAASYTANGVSITNDIVKILESNRIDISNSRILDFASGPGRVAGFLSQRFPNAKFFATDIDVEAISWAQVRFNDEIKFSSNEVLPPTHFDSQSFDLIYTVSLFTHLDEQLQFQWLKELQRILRPNGYLVATVHGELARSTCTSSELEAIRTKGILFRTDRIGLLKLDGLPDFYQTTFHSENYVRNRWADYFEIVDYQVGGIQNHQDAVVLKRRSA